MKSTKQPFYVVILAANREMKDPVAEAAAVSCKALAPVSGRAMVLRVLDALADAHEVGVRILVGPAMASVEQNAELAGLIRSGQVQWFEPKQHAEFKRFQCLAVVTERCPGAAHDG